MKKKKSTPPVQQLKQSASASPSESAHSHQSTFVVGIGACVKFPECFTRLLSHLPSDSGISFIILNNHPEISKETLQKSLSSATRMPVEIIKNKMTIQPNHIYLLPSHGQLTIRNEKLLLNKNGSDHRSRIDHFFHSLADSRKHMSAAVILEGDGSDGALGLKSIKENGGLAVVLDPAGALFPSMPRNAVSTRTVDRVLPLEEIPKTLLHYFHHLQTKARESQIEFDKAYLDRIVQALRKTTGHDFKDYKKNMIIRRIQRRMQIQQIDSIKDYAKRVGEDTQEAHDLFKDLLIHVTHFFRDKDAFAALEKIVIPDIFKKKLKQKDEEIIRIWVPGCATGEESYSLAILVREFQRKSGKIVPVQIFASDIDERSLEYARRGTYSESIIELLGERRLEQFFEKRGEMYQVKKEIREMCIFSLHSLINHPPFSRLDLISCRNLLIYLENDLQKKLLPIFHYALHPNGYLFLGPSENVTSHPELFQLIDKNSRIFQAKERSPLTRIDMPIISGRMPFNNLIHLPTMERPEKKIEPDETSLKKIFERVLLDKFAPPSVIVNNEGGIYYISGDTSPYLKLVVGTPNLNVIEMAEQNLKFHIRTGLLKASNDKKTVEKEVVFASPKKRTVRLVIKPFQESGKIDNLFIVIFKELNPLAQPEKEQIESSRAQRDEHIDQLERELQNTKEYLQTTVEELESSNEELKSSNEELMSMNEEFQSSNEEMQTSKEELQSMNEELQTVNSELNQKIEELDAANSDLENFFDSTQIATLFLDKNFCIKRYTPYVYEMFRIIESDIGRPITDFSRRFTNGNMIDEAKRVMRTLERRKIEVRRPESDEWFLMQISPYRTVNHVIDGVTISFIDITHHKRSENEILRLNEELQQLNRSLEAKIDERTAEVERRCRQVRNLTVELLEVEQQERHRISQLLHDTLQQLLTSLKIRIIQTLREGKIDETSDKVRKTLSLVEESIATSKNLAIQLYPPLNLSQGLKPTLEWLARWAKKDLQLDVHLIIGSQDVACSEDVGQFIYTALKEFIFNIFKHAQVDTAELSYSVRKDGSIEIQLRDNGVGFEVGKIEASQKEGLGLFSIQQRIETLGGRLKIESKKEKGTTFILLLPPEAVKPAQNRRRQSDQPAARLSPGGKIKVLVIDDHDNLRQQLVERINEQPDMMVIGEGKNGLEGVVLAKKLRPDFICMDISMPKINGVEATKKIRKAGYKGCIIGLSMHDDEDTRQSILDAGAEYFFSKNNVSDKLTKTIRTHVHL